MSKEFWNRLKTRRRVAVVDDESLNELWSFRLSALGLTIVMVLMLIVTIVLLSLLIIHTPLRTFLPGYDENIHERLMTESERLDSLTNTVMLQRQYLDVIRNITAGEVSSDTIQPLDSLQLIAQEELLQAKLEATEDFVAAYEQKEKDNLLLFDVQDVKPILTIFRPAHGVITQTYDSRAKQYGILLQTPEKENVTAVLAGTIVLVDCDIDGTYTIVMQHQNYVSIYANMQDVTKHNGDVVHAGETIGLMRAEHPLRFELWKDGLPINPEEVIAF